MEANRLWECGVIMENLKNHYQEVFIEEINDNILRCRILGKIIDKTDNTLLLDDGTGIIEVMINEDLTKINSPLEIGQDVFVFGKVIKIDGNYKVFADIIREIKNLNIRQYRKVMKLWKESEVI